MGKPKEANRSAANEAVELGLEFDLEVDGDGNGVLVLRAGNKRYIFTNNGVMLTFLDGVRAGRELAANECGRQEP